LDHQVKLVPAVNQVFLDCQDLMVLRGIPVTRGNPAEKDQKDLQATRDLSGSQDRAV